MSPLAEEPAVPAAPPTSTKSRGATSGTEAETPSKQPKSATRRTRREKGSRAVMERTALQYQLLLEQQKNRRLMEELSSRPQKIDLGTELDQLYTKSKVDLQEKLDETLSLDGFLWKLMLSLLETRQSGKPLRLRSCPTWKDTITRRCVDRRIGRKGNGLYLR